MPKPFLFGTNYWPAGAAYPSWERLDRGALREELAVIASLGLQAIRTTLWWESFQPSAHRINSTVMRRYEYVLGYAAELGLQVVPVLFGGTFGEALHLPVWATGVNAFHELRLLQRFGASIPLSQQLLFSEGSWRNTTVRDLYHDDEQLTAQRYHISEIAGYFAQHPAIAEWQIDATPLLARRPDSTNGAGDWIAARVEDLQRSGVTHISAVLTPQMIAQANRYRPDRIARETTSICISAEPYAPLQTQGVSPQLYAAFWHALTRELLEYQHVAVSGLSLSPTAPARDTPPTQQAQSSQTDTQQTQAIAEGTLQLYHAGASQVWLPAYADAAPDSWKQPPLDTGTSLRQAGIVTFDREEKPAADAVRATAAALRQADTPQGPSARLDVDPERYLRDPRRELQRLFALLKT